ADDRFTADHLIPAMSAKVRMTWLDKVTYRFVLIPFVRKRLLEQGEALAWAKRRPAWGPGRIDPFNPVKFGMLHLTDDGTIGNSDMQAVWNLDARERIRPHAPLHWDGLNNSVREVVISSALGDGTVAREFSLPAMERIERFLRTLPPPPSPHRPDAAAVERGKAVFAANCAECHAPDGARTLSVILLAEVGTDINRSHMWTELARDTYNNFREGRDWGSGPIFTTARFRPYATFSSHRRRGRPRSFAASMWWMHVMAGSSPPLSIRASNPPEASSSTRAASATAMKPTPPAPRPRP